jgi:hypothetical protein
MGRYLIVANQTLGGAELGRLVQDRIARGTSQFYIVVPLTAPQHEAKVWTGGFLMPVDVTSDATLEAMEEEARKRDAVLDEAARRANHRLRQMIERVRSAGGEAEGTVGDPDPAAAVTDALREQSFDEVIVSTLPAGISRWLKMDLPSQVSRMTDVPVTTVEAED